MVSDDSLAVETAQGLQDAAASAVDREEVSSLLEDDGAEAAGRTVGGRLGKAVGGYLGRELGGVVAVDVRDRVSPRRLLADLRDRLLELLRGFLRDVDVEAAASRLSSLVVGLATDRSPDVDLEGVLPGADADAAADQGDGGDGEAAADDLPVDASTVSADDLRDLKRETYRDLLEQMSYRDMQSVAKDLDVKANLGREEMTDSIVETLAGDADESDGSGESGETSDGDEEAGES